MEQAQSVSVDVWVPIGTAPGNYLGNMSISARVPAPYSTSPIATTSAYK